MVSITVTIPPKDIAYLKKLSNMPQLVPAAIQRGLDTALQEIKTVIQETRLSGTGPYPPSMHRLGDRSGDLRDSIYTRTTMRGKTVIGEIGADPNIAPYAAVHEYGAVIHARNKPFLVFKIEGRTIRTKSVTIPARQPIGYELGLKRSADTISHAIIAEVQDLASE